MRRPRAMRRPSRNAAAATSRKQSIRTSGPIPCKVMGGSYQKSQRTRLRSPRMKRRLLATLLLPFAVLGGTGSDAAPDEALAQYRNIPLWHVGQVPGAAGDGPLDAPFVTVFAPRAGKANGGAVVIAPGGGNIMLMYGGEGADVAEVFNDWGVTAFVLTYRLSPRYDQAARNQDAERALRLVRANAAAWHLDPARVGFIGFSAGGSLGRSMMAVADAGDPRSGDPVDRASSRP